MGSRWCGGGRYIFRLEVKRKRSCLVCGDGCSSVSGSEWLHLGREGDVVERSRGTAELIPMVMIDEVEKVGDCPSFQIQLSILRPFKMPLNLPQHLARLTKYSPLHHPPPIRATHHAGGTNLEIFKFGMYIMFPIGWMYYFGTNLDSRFNVPDFWPKPGETHTIPFEKDEQLEMKNRLREVRLARRRRGPVRKDDEVGSEEGANGDGDGVGVGVGVGVEYSGREEGATGEMEAVDRRRADGVRAFGPGAIESWARGRG